MNKMVSGIYAWRHQTDVKVAVDPKALADLRRRQAMPDTRDNTARLLGDPPPGRSALDQKREAEARKAAGWITAPDVEEAEGD